MAKTKKQNSTQVPNGGSGKSGAGDVPPTYSVTYPSVTGAGFGGTNYSNITIATAGAGLTYSSGAGSMPTWTSATDTWYTKQPKVKITDQDIELDGLSLRETMLAIKNELQIPTRINRNPELEKEFAELQAAADQYYKLEKEFLEQKKMWETLKK